MSDGVDNPLARFATESGRISDSAVKPKLFEPNRQLLLSVFRISNLKNEEIQNIGVEVVRQHRTARRLYGWAEFSASSVDEIGLQLENDDVPPRHSNIKGWPEDPEERKLLRMELANRANPVKLDPPVEVNQNPS